MLHGSKNTQTLAAKLRRQMSLPELVLWRELRKRPFGLKFRRQHPAGPYVLDFFCAQHRLAIEIDGAAHDMGDRPGRDIARDAWLQRQGVRTRRILATDVLNDVEAVVRQIIDNTRGDYPSTAFGGPPPPPGEEL